VEIHLTAAGLGHAQQVLETMTAALVSLDVNSHRCSVCEPAEDVPQGDVIQGGPDTRKPASSSSWLYSAHEGFDLGKEHLDAIEVRAVVWQEQDRKAVSFDARLC
jgi:hypothetical protein